MERVMRLGALNIVAQPHSAEIYEHLIKAARRKRGAARIRSDRFGMLSSATGPVQGVESYIDGRITTFTRIDADSDWINVRSGKAAIEDDLAGLNIPKNLQPNGRFHRYRFYLNSHVLVFEVGNGGNRLTARNAGTLFNRIFSQESIFDDFGEIAVTVLPERATVERIVNSNTIRSVSYVVHAPNPDDGREAERRFTQRLETMRVQRLEQTVVAKKNEYVKPDEQLKSDIRVAANNGSVNAKIVEGKRVVPVSTEETPFEYVHLYWSGRDQDVHGGEFNIAADRVLTKLRE